MIASDRLAAAYQTAPDALFAERHSDGYWVGELSASPLSTATTLSAFSLASKSADDSPLNEPGFEWLPQPQRFEAGWGVAVEMFINLLTTMLCRAAIHL